MSTQSVSRAGCFNTDSDVSILFHSQFYFKSGFTVAISPASWAVYKVVNNNQTVLVSHTSAAVDGQLLSIVIAPSA